MMLHNDWTRSEFLHTEHCDNTKAVYIQNHVGVYLALGREGEGERGRQREERGNEREKEERIKEK